MVRVTDDERREVAERLRALSGLDYCKDPRYAVGLASDAAGADHSNGYSWDKLLYRLADLIDPDCDASATHTDASATRDMSQNCRDAVVCDRDMLYVTYSRSTCGPDGMAYMVRVRHRDKGWERDFYAVDREALLELSGYLDAVSLGGWASGPVNVGEIARRIREACGEVAE